MSESRAHNLIAQVEREILVCELKHLVMRRVRIHNIEGKTVGRRRF